MLIGIIAKALTLSLNNLCRNSCIHESVLLSMEGRSAFLTCKGLAPGKFELTNQDSAGRKTFTVLKSGTFSATGQKKRFTIPKTISDCKSEKYETLFVVFKLVIWRQNCVANVRHGNSLVDRRKIAMLFWTKYTIPRQITRNSQFNYEAT